MVTPKEVEERSRTRRTACRQSRAPASQRESFVSSRHSDESEKRGDSVRSKMEASNRYAAAIDKSQ